MGDSGVAVGLQGGRGGSRRSGGWSGGRCYSSYSSALLGKRNLQAGSAWEGEGLGDLRALGDLGPGEPGQGNPGQKERGREDGE